MSEVQLSIVNKFVAVIKSTLPKCDDLRKPRYQGNPNLLAGHCYIASEALCHALRTLEYVVKPMFVRHEGEPHWYLEVEGVGVVDPTVEQFTSIPDYSAGRGKGFLTFKPSKRTDTLLQRMV